MLKPLRLTTPMGDKISKYIKTFEKKSKRGIQLISEELKNGVKQLNDMYEGSEL